MPVASKDFHKQTKVTAMLTINVTKVVLSDSVAYKKQKNWQSIDGFQVVKAFVKTSKLKHQKDIFVKTSKMYLVMIYLNTTRDQLI